MKFKLVITSRICYMELNGAIRGAPNIAVHGHSWPYVAAFIAVHVHTKTYVAVHSRAWPCIAVRCCI